MLWMLLNIQNYRDFFDAHFLEQYFTASQFNLHFFLQLNGKLHVTHTFHSRFFFINTLVVEVEGSIGSSVDLRNEAAPLKTAEKMNTPPVKTKKLAGCHFWDKQPLSAMISPTTKTSQAASQKQSTPHFSHQWRDALNASKHSKLSRFFWCAFFRTIFHSLPI